MGRGLLADQLNSAEPINTRATTTYNQHTYSNTNANGYPSSINTPIHTISQPAPKSPQQVNALPVGIPSSTDSNLQLGRNTGLLASNVTTNSVLEGSIEEIWYIIFNTLCIPIYQPIINTAVCKIIKRDMLELKDNKKSDIDSSKVLSIIYYYKCLLLMDLTIGWENSISQFPDVNLFDNDSLPLLPLLYHYLRLHFLLPAVLNQAVNNTHTPSISLLYLLSLFPLLQQWLKPFMVLQWLL